MPSSNDDTSWDDVYAELGIEVPKPKSAESAPEPAPTEEVAFEEEPAATWPDEIPPLEVEPVAVTEDMIVQATEGDEEGEEPAEGEASESAEPGTEPERKRRRRRRRRRKSGTAEEGSEPVAATVGAPQAEAYEEEGETVAGHSGSFSEDTPPDTLRDLIATWNVPSWDEIISGLYRPER